MKTESRFNVSADGRMVNSTQRITRELAKANRELVNALKTRDRARAALKAAERRVRDAKRHVDMVVNSVTVPIPNGIGSLD